MRAGASDGLLVLLRFLPEGGCPRTIGVLLLDLAGNRLELKIRSDLSAIASAEDSAMLRAIAADLRKKAAVTGGRELLDYLTSTLSHTVQVSDPVRVRVSDFKTALREFFIEYVS